jgi:uncharacterized Fe-S cluster-containing radical SAM superfamily protein
MAHEPFMPERERPGRTGKLPHPAKRTRADYGPKALHAAGLPALLAPYTRFRPTEFYDSLAYGGTYTADIWGCPWRCQRCWSYFGHSEGRAKYECTPGQVVDRFIAGMQQNTMAGSRISGGDAGYWWPHVRAVIDEFLDRTRGKSIEFKNGPPHREPMILVIETSGGIRITPEQLADVERVHGEHTRNLVLSIGMKATNPEKLAELTGQPAATARASHDRQLALIRTALELEHMQVLVGFLDAFSDEDEFDELREEFELRRPGMFERTNQLNFVRSWGK